MDLSKNNKKNIDYILHRCNHMTNKRFREKINKIFSNKELVESLKFQEIDEYAPLPGFNKYDQLLYISNYLWTINKSFYETIEPFIDRILNPPTLEELLKIDKEYNQIIKRRLLNIEKLLKIDKEYNQIIKRRLLNIEKELMNI